jgi:hypothetical protein
MGGPDWIDDAMARTHGVAADSGHRQAAMSPGAVRLLSVT